MYILKNLDIRLKTEFAQFVQMLGKLTQVPMSQTVIVCEGGAFAHSLLVCPKKWDGEIWTNYTVAARPGRTYKHISNWRKHMKNMNDTIHSVRIPAENYRARARAVLTAMLGQMKTVAGPGRWKEPTEAQMEGLVDEFHAILNWALDGARRLGYPVEHFPGPLTEAEMRSVEGRFAGNAVR
jgi:hypothetical protein